MSLVVKMVMVVLVCSKTSCTWILLENVEAGSITVWFGFVFRKIKYKCFVLEETILSEKDVSK